MHIPIHMRSSFYGYDEVETCEIASGYRYFQEDSGSAASEFRTFIIVIRMHYDSIIISKNREVPLDAPRCRTANGKSRNRRLQRAREAFCVVVHDLCDLLFGSLLLEI